MLTDDDHTRRPWNPPAPAWPFPAAYHGERVSLSALTTDNYVLLPPLFRDEDNPFVDGRFTNEGLLYVYVRELHYLAAPSRRRGGMDYLVYAADDPSRPHGIAHLFNLHADVPDAVPEVGLMIGRRSRRRGLGRATVLLLENLLLTLRPGTREVAARILPANTPSLRLFEDLGYRVRGGGGEEPLRLVKTLAPPDPPAQL